MEELAVVLALVADMLEGTQRDATLALSSSQVGLAKLSALVRDLTIIVQLREERIAQLSAELARPTRATSTNLSAFGGGTF